MHHLGLRSAEDHTYDIEPVHRPGPVKAAHPVASRLGHLPLLPPVNRAQRTTIGSGDSSLYFNESDHSSVIARRKLHHEIDVTMSASKSPVENSPASRREPPFCDALAALSE